MDRPRILTIDDEENFLVLLKRVLEKEGYDVWTAASGEEALQLLAEQTFDLALIDIRMAPMDGLSVLEHIRRNYPLTSAIMVTGYPTPQGRMLAMQKKALAFLAKPVSMDQLKETIRTALSR